MEPRLVVADREQGPIDHLAEHRALDGGVRRFAVVGDAWEVAVGHADDPIRDLARANLGPVVVRFLERDFLARSVRDELVKILGAERDPAFVRVRALELGCQRDVEIGRCDEKLVLALRPQQHVRQHRHRALAVSNALSEPQSAQEFVLCDFKFHRPFPRSALLFLYSDLRSDLVVGSRRCCEQCG